MREFKSVFNKKNKLLRYTLVVYCIASIIGVTALFYVGFNFYIFVYVVFTSLMAIRAFYFISEKLIVDTDNGVVILKILRKKFNVSQIKSIKKIRQGQIRLINMKGEQFPVSVENEDDFISLLQNINASINIE